VASAVTGQEQLIRFGLNIRSYAPDAGPPAGDAVGVPVHN